MRLAGLANGAAPMGSWTCMLLWLAILCLTALTALVVARPLLRPAPAADAATEVAGKAVRAVYVDQLAELSAEVARGTIAATDAEAARIEISRRLLADGAAAAKGPGTMPGEAPVASRLLVLAAVPLIALGSYGLLGSPSLPGKPSGAVVARPPSAKGPSREIEDMVARVEARLREAPQDGRGWDAVAPVYLKMRRYEDARIAFGRAIALQGETTKRLAGLAESAVRGNDGVVTDEARTAYEKLLKAEPARLDARFWLAVAREQGGEARQAADEYRAILSVAPADAPWREAVAERLAAVVAAAAPADAAAKGPTEAQAEAARDLSPQERQQMIASMVEGLHARLKANGRDAAGWQKLLRAYGVQGERAKAVAALAEARRALDGDSQGLAALEALARDMGLGS